MFAHKLVPRHPSHWTSAQMAKALSFHNLINIALDMINKKVKPISSHCPYLSENLQKAISVKVLYDTGANISCISRKYSK